MSFLLNFLIYSRAILHYLWIFGVTIILGGIAILFEWMRGRSTVGRIAQLWGSCLLWFCGIEVIVKHKENIPQKPFLLLFNHSSYLDILVLLSGIPYRLHFGAKKYLFHIPIFGRLIKNVGHFPIDPNRPRSVYETYLSLGKQIKRGDVFALSPEGGRTRGPNLRRFQKGPFIMAVFHHLTIVPVIIKGARECMPIGCYFFNLRSWKFTITVECLPPTSTQNLHKTDIPNLKNQIYQQMTDANSRK